LTISTSTRFAGLLSLLCLFCLALNAAQPPRLHVQTISILGTQKTKKAVILRELTFAEGDSLEAAELAAIMSRNQQNVYNLGLFNKVEFDYETLEGKLYVFILVKERWYIFPRPHLRVEERNTYDLISAIGSGNFNRLAYGMFVKWRNVGGYNETLQFYGQLGFSKRLYIDFLRPAIFPRERIDMIMGFHHVNEKEVIYGSEEGRVRWGRIETEASQKSFNAYLGFRKRFSVFNSLYAELSFKNYLFADSIYTFQLYGEPARFITNPHGREYYPRLLLSYVNDRRDLRSFPTQGYKYQLFGSISGFPGMSSTRFAKIGGTWAHHLPLSRRWNFSYGTHHIYTIGKKLPFFAKSAIGVNRRDFPGISTTLRGYEPYLIDGSYVMMTKAELKYGLLPRKMFHLDAIPFAKFQDFPLGIYLTAFFDLGYVSDQSISNQDQFFKNKWLTGYGAGLNIIGIYDLLLRVEYARNHLGQGGIYLHSSVQIK